MGVQCWLLTGLDTRPQHEGRPTLYTEETPSSLCTEVNSTVCHCITHGDVRGQEEVEWRYVCGSCLLRWRPNRDEEAIAKRKEEKRLRMKTRSKKQKERKKDLRMKMRKKMKLREGRLEKKRKGSSNVKVSTEK